MGVLGSAQPGWADKAAGFACVDFLKANRGAWGGRVRRVLRVRNRVGGRQGSRLCLRGTPQDQQVSMLYACCRHKDVAFPLTPYHRRCHEDVLTSDLRGLTGEQWRQETGAGLCLADVLVSDPDADSARSL